jgi:hypothetical protein
MKIRRKPDAATRNTFIDRAANYTRLAKITSWRIAKEYYASCPLEERSEWPTPETLAILQLKARVSARPKTRRARKSQAKRAPKVKKERSSN